MQVRPTQALPPATYALLHSLAPVHSAHFPRIARAVHADTSEYSTEAQVKEAEQKIALSKSVLGGWLQSVEADLEGGKDWAETTENLTTLIETLPGSLSSLRVHPRLLLHTGRRTATSPSKGASNLPSTASALPAANELDPEEDLATFLVPRCLSVCVRLQATLLDSPFAGGAQPVPEGVLALRQAALVEVETFLRGIIETLAGSALRLDWHGGGTKDASRGNAVGKAKEIVEALLEVVRALLPETHSDLDAAFPRILYLFRNSHTTSLAPLTPSKRGGIAGESRYASLCVRSPLEAVSSVLSVLRVLTASLGSTAYLGEYRATLVELIAQSWPRRHALCANAEASGGKKGKGKGRNDSPGDPNHLSNTLVIAWTSLLDSILDEPDAAARFELQILAELVLHEVRARVIEPTSNLHAYSEAPDVDSKEAEILLLAMIAKIWSLALQRDARGAGLQETLQGASQIMLDLAELMQELAEARDSPDAIAPLLTAFAAGLPLSPDWSSAGAGDRLFFDLRQGFLDLLRRVYDSVPPQHQPLGDLAPRAIASAQAAALSASYQLSGRGQITKRKGDVDGSDESSPRKRQRLAVDENAAEAVGQRRETIRHLTTAVLAWHRQDAEREVAPGAASILAAGADETAEQTMLRYIAAVPSASAELGTHLIRAVGHLACAQGGNLAFDATNDLAPSAPSCQVCDAGLPSTPPNSDLDSIRPLSREPLASLMRLYETTHGDAQAGQQQLDTRLLVLDALRRITSHSPLRTVAAKDPLVDVLNLLKQDLRSSIRGVRCAAGETLLALAFAVQTHNVDSAAVKALFDTVDEVLALSTSKPFLAETALQLAGRLARIAEPQGLIECESLARILGRLGDRNVFIKQLAKQQLAQIAAHRAVRPYALVSPHFSVLSSILISSMSILGTALDVFHQSRESLLRVTREHTLPRIVLDRRDALLKEVAEASRLTVAEMLCDPPVASAVLAFLLMQPDGPRAQGLKYLVAACRGVLLGQLIESVHVPLVYRLVLGLGDEQAANVSRATRGLHLAERFRLGYSADMKIDISETLRNTIVGLLSHMNRGLHEANHQRPLRDKQKIIRSLDAITRMVGRAISGFSPQIMATLQTALEVPGLRLVTLRAFRSFIQSLKFADIGTFIAPTTAAFVRLWPELSLLEREAAVATVKYIVVENGDNLSEYVKDVADLSGIPELRDAQRALRLVRRAWTFESHLDYLLDRVASENEVVALQGLRELQSLLAASTSQLHALAAGDTFDDRLGRLVAVLLAATSRDGTETESHRNVAFECIGIVGAVDPDRFDLPPVEQPPVVVENYLDSSESVQFAIRLIVDLLVGAYQSTNDTRHQELLGYAIQELLRFCNFTEAVVTANVKTAADELNRNRWLSLPKGVMEACTPLLTTRFSITTQVMDEVAFPIYAGTSSYRDWVRSFANELRKRASGQTAQQIFSPFAGLFHLEDTTTAQYLLPHLVLHVLISGKESDREAIRVEIATILQDQVAPSHDLSENSRLLSAQTVFSLMDHLSRWITQAKKLLAEIKAQRKKSKKERPTNEREIHEGLLCVEGVLQDVPHVLVGQAALTCKAYARSLLNFESHIVAERRKKGPECDKDLQVYYENLHECYAHLDEPDGMEGISTRIISPSVQHQIREHESTGRWTSAQSCWEVLLQQTPAAPVNHVGLLRCLRNLGHYDSMRTHIAGLFASRSDAVDWERVLAPFNIEASVFGGDWSAVEDALDVPDVEGPEVAFGRALCAMRSGDQDLVERVFFEARESLGAPIVAAGRGSYRRVYDSIIHLHILDELKQIQRVQLQGPDEMVALGTSLAERLHASAPSFRAREPILNLRRVAFKLAAGGDSHLNAQVGSLWLETSKIARKAGHFQTAYSAILQARDCHADFTFFQSAKLFKANDQTYKAIQEIDNAISPMLASAKEAQARAAHVNKKGTSPLAKAALCRVRWMLEAGRLEINEAASLFTEVDKLAPLWENAPYYLGRFWDSQADEKEKKQPRSKHSRHAVEVASYRVQTVKLYLAALTRGTKFIYQTLPRTLTIWLELGERPQVIEGMKTKPADTNDGDMHDLTRCFKRTNRHVREAVTSRPIPTYLWLTVLPQVVSRILHANPDVYDVLETILRRVLDSFPHHGFWAMASGAKSTTNRRAKRNSRVFQKAKDDAVVQARGGDVGALIDEGLRLADQLLVLCNFAINDKTDTLSLKRTFPSLHRITPTKIIIPLQNSLTVSLPFDASQAASYKPFPEHLPTFQSFDDQILIMSSLQKPRKITVRGSDGQSYGFLCKPKDDLRKDARLMEFNSMIIKLLKKDSDARSRKLNIRTYSVVPLNEECGLIEWVPHVVVLRGVLSKRYASMNIASWSPELKRIFETIRDDPKRTAERFETEVLRSFPSIFHEWFLENFPEPSAWHRARLAYSRTAAVISIVGFVLGLGDRHCENILLDGTTGDTVHVDFNCLFDKGRTFEVAERVPFRLTHNIIDGMGVTGVEGVYRRSSEITLRILRANKDSLRSVLETFLHDPLVEWVHSGRRRDSSVSPDQTKARALEALEPISNKLTGLQVTSDPESLGSKEVTIEEQVERLIREARNPHNLGSMYVGWCAWF